MEEDLEEEDLEPCPRMRILGDNLKSESLECTDPVLSAPIEVDNFSDRPPTGRRGAQDMICCALTGG